MEPTQSRTHAAVLRQLAGLVVLHMQIVVLGYKSLREALRL